MIVLDEETTIIKSPLWKGSKQQNQHHNNNSPNTCFGSSSLSSSLLSLPSIPIQSSSSSSSCKRLQKQRNCYPMIGFGNNSYNNISTTNVCLGKMEEEKEKLIKNKKSHSNILIHKNKNNNSNNDESTVATESTTTTSTSSASESSSSSSSVVIDVIDCVTTNTEPKTATPTKSKTRLKKVRFASTTTNCNSNQYYTSDVVLTNQLVSTLWYSTMELQLIIRTIKRDVSLFVQNYEQQLNSLYNYTSNDTNDNACENDTNTSSLFNEYHYVQSYRCLQDECLLLSDYYRNTRTDTTATSTAATVTFDYWNTKYTNEIQIVLYNTINNTYRGIESLLVSSSSSLDDPVSGKSQKRAIQKQLLIIIQQQQQQQKLSTTYTQDNTFDYNNTDTNQLVLAKLCQELTYNDSIRSQLLGLIDEQTVVQM